MTTTYRDYSDPQLISFKAKVKRLKAQAEVARLTEQQGDTMSKTWKSPDMGTVMVWCDNGGVELMRLSASGLWVNPDIPATECAQRVLEALRPLIQHTIDEAVERRQKDIEIQLKALKMSALLSERGTR